MQVSGIMPDTCTITGANKVIIKGGTMLEKAIKKYRQFPIQVKASFWFLVCSFAQKGISTLTTPIFTRLLSTSEYGQYSVFNSWLGIVTIFVSMNLSSGVYSQGLVKFDNESKIFSSSLQGLSLMLTALWTVIYIAFSEFWNALFKLSTVQMAAMLIMIWSTAAFGFWATEQKVNLKYKELVILTLVISIAKPSVGVYLVLNADDKVTARIIGLALVELVGYTGLFVRQMLNGKVFFSFKFWKYALRFNLPLIPHYLSVVVLGSSDRIMIERMAGSDAAGIYNLAYSISLIMTLFNNALMQTLSPWIYQKIKQEKTNDIAPIAYMTLFIVAIVNLVLIAFAPEVVAIFAPVEYYDAIWVIPPVAMSVYFTFCYDLFAKFEFYYEKTYFIMIASVLGAVLNIILNYIFIPEFGYCAAGYTTLVCYMVYAFGHFIFMKKICKKYLRNTEVYNFKILLGITLAFLLSGFVLLLTYRIMLLRYGIILIGIITLIVKRERIKDFIKKLIEIRKKKEDR